MTASTTEAAPPFVAGRGYTRWLLTLLILIYTSNFIDRTIVSTLGQAIKRDLGLSDAQLGMLTGLVFAVFYTGLGIPLARLAERKNRVTILAVCTAIWSAMTALCGVANGYGQLLVARMGVGVGEAGFTPCAQSLISDHYPANKRASALAIYCLGIPAGTMIGAIAGGWIAQHLNWRIAFMIVGLPGLVLAGLAMLTLKEPPRGLSEPERPRALTAPPLTAVLKTLLSKPAVLLATLGAGLASIAGYGLTAFIAPYFVRRFHFDYAQAGLVLGLISGVPNGIGMLFGGYVSDWIGRGDKRSYGWAPALALIVTAPLCVIALLQAEWAPAVAMLTIAALFQQAYLPPTFSLANNMVEPRMRATSVALLSFIWGLIGLGIGPLLTGIVSDRFAGDAFVSAGGGNFAALCPGGHGLTALTAKTCAAASTTGLQHALIGITAFYVLAAATYLMATRTMRRDLAAY